MRASHLEFLVEEPSMEAFLRTLLPRVLPKGCTFEVHAFQGKADLLRNLEARLRSYARWLPREWRVVVVVDRDREDCRRLKARLEAIAQQVRLRSRSRAGNGPWQLVNRVAVEELEAWYFGDWQAVCTAYPRVCPDVPHRQGLRDPDAIAGGTWEAFERVMQGHGYFEGGLLKIEAARRIGAHVEPTRITSRSFRSLVQAILEAVA